MANVPAAVLRSAVSVIVTVAILGAFGTVRSSPSPIQSSTLRGVTVTGNPRLPPGCNSAHDTAVSISNFLDAFNGGDNSQIGRFFGPDLLWYSVTESNRNFVAYHEEDLLKYFEGRHANHERLQLVSIDVEGPSWHGGVDIVYTLTRQADDLGIQGQSVRGKGAVNCERRTIFVWSMGSGS
jgi:hypothetical protein